MPSLLPIVSMFLCFFYFNDPAPTEIYTLSLHDALPIYVSYNPFDFAAGRVVLFEFDLRRPVELEERSEEHTSELQSHHDLVCRLLLEKKKYQEIVSRFKKVTSKDQTDNKAHNDIDNITD